MISLSELTVIFFVMLLVLGPKQLLTLAQQTGRLWARVERLTNDMKQKALVGWQDGSGMD